MFSREYCHISSNREVYGQVFFFYCNAEIVKGKGKVFYGQEPPSGECTTTECGFNYQLLAVIYRSRPMWSS